MKVRGTVDCGIWKSHHFKSLNDAAKLLAMYLRACESGNIIGCFHLPMAYMAGDLRWDVKKIKDTLSILSTEGFVLYCETTEYVFLPKHLIKFPIRGSKQAVGAYRIYQNIPDEFRYLREITELLIKCEAFEHDVTEELCNRIGVLPEEYVSP